MLDFYVGLEKCFENNDALRLFQDSVNNYLNLEPWTQESNCIKTIIFETATDLEREALRELRNYFSDVAKIASWKEKKLLYEISAWLYNLALSTREHVDTKDLPSFV